MPWAKNINNKDVEKKKKKKKNNLIKNCNVNAQQEINFCMSYFAFLFHTYMF